jgi:hypothetical protein
MKPSSRPATLSRITLLAAVFAFGAFAQAPPVPAAPAPPASSPANDEYAALLRRVQQGDMDVDFRAFRLAGLLSSGGAPGSMREQGDRAAFRKLMAAGDSAGALDAANKALARNYASIVNHFDAMVACQALQKTDEAAAHEKLMNALLDSIQKSGDGKSLETAWFVVTTTEEYIFISRILGLKAKSQGFVPRDGHFYDRMEVVDPKTNETSSLWFNTDVDMGAYKSPAPGKAPLPK